MSLMPPIPVNPERRSLMWTLAVVVGLIVCMAVFAVWPAFFPPPHSAPGATCISNLKRLAIGEMVYAADNDDRLPQATAWMDLTLPYVKYDEFFRCPVLKKSPAAYGYAMDVTLSVTETASIVKPETVPQLFESVLLVWNATSGFYGFPDPPRHSRGVNVVYADGHANRLPLKGP